VDLRHLILVPGHAIVRDIERLDRDEGWYLKPFQLGEGPFYVEHVRYGARLAIADPQSLLVFSGSRTYRYAERSEAEGYRMIAERYGWEGSPEVAARTALEEYALDSFQNLQFAIRLFRERTGTDPASIHVAGWGFKEARFGFHRETLGYPSERFHYHGVNNPPALAEAVYHEAETLRLFRENPTGDSGPLARKRAERNPPEAPSTSQ
jgi:hypothetical protein